MTAKTMHPTEAQLRAVLTTLADRWERTAAKATTALGKQRALQISQAAKDIRQVLTTGRIPARLMTDAELAALLPAQPAQIADEETAS